MTIPVSLAPGSVAKNFIDGNPDNIHMGSNRETHPVERHGPRKGMVKLSLPWIVPSKKNAFVLVLFDASLDERNHLLLSFGVMLNVSGGGAEIGMTGQHLDITKGAARFADFPSRVGDESSAT